MHVPHSVTKRLEQVQLKHADKFAADEQLLSACAVVSVDAAEPSGLSAKFSFLGDLFGAEPDKTEIYQRVDEVRRSTGSVDVVFTALPKSKTGYTFVMTNKRIVVFDGTLKNYVTQCDRDNLLIENVRHDNGLISVLLREDDQIVAVTTKRQQEEDAEHFLAQPTLAMASPAPAAPAASAPPAPDSENQDDSAVHIPSVDAANANPEPAATEPATTEPAATEPTPEVAAAPAIPVVVAPIVVAPTPGSAPSAPLAAALPVRPTSNDPTPPNGTLPVRPTSNDPTSPNGTLPVRSSSSAPASEPVNVASEMPNVEALTSEALMAHALSPKTPSP